MLTAGVGKPRGRPSCEPSSCLGLAFPGEVVGRRSSEAQSHPEAAGDPSASREVLGARAGGCRWVRAHVLGVAGLCGSEGSRAGGAAPRVREHRARFPAKWVPSVRLS